MKIRKKYIIVGTRHNGKRGVLLVYASSKEVAEDYAQQHFQEYKIPGI